MDGRKMLAVLVFGCLNIAFVMAIIYGSHEARAWFIGTYITVVSLYSALYCYRRGHMSEELRHHFGMLAVTLGASLSALFFYTCPPGMPWSVAGAVWVWLATAAYFLYRVLIFDDEEEAEQAHVDAGVFWSRLATAVYFLFRVLIFTHNQEAAGQEQVAARRPPV